MGCSWLRSSELQPLGSMIFLWSLSSFPTLLLPTPNIFALTTKTYSPLSEHTVCSEATLPFHMLFHRSRMSFFPSIHQNQAPLTRPTSKANCIIKRWNNPFSLPLGWLFLILLPHLPCLHYSWPCVGVFLYQTVNSMSAELASLPGSLHSLIFCLA